MIINEFNFRLIAVLAAVAIVAGPTLVGYARKVASWRPTRADAQAEQADDAHTIVEIARRLQKAGSEKGVGLCQQLLDVMLKPGN